MKKVLYCLSLLCLMTISCYGMDYSSGLENTDPDEVVVEGLEAITIKNERRMTVKEYIEKLNFPVCKIGNESLCSEEQIKQMIADLENMDISKYNELVGVMQTRGKKRKKDPSLATVYALSAINKTLETMHEQSKEEARVAKQSLEIQKKMLKKQKQSKNKAYTAAFVALFVAITEFIAGGGWLASFCGEGS